MNIRERRLYFSVNFSIIFSSEKDTSLRSIMRMPFEYFSIESTFIYGAYYISRSDPSRIQSLNILRQNKMHIKRYDP